MKLPVVKLPFLLEKDPWEGESSVPWKSITDPTADYPLSRRGLPVGPRWQQVDDEGWPFPHFKPRELACKGTGRLVINVDMLEFLEALRAGMCDYFGRDCPLNLNSCYRSWWHNKKIGGKKGSRHLHADACDVSTLNFDSPARAYLHTKAKKEGFKGFGYYANFLHMDLWKVREWGDKDAFFLNGETGLQSEPVRSPEGVLDDKQLWGVASAAAGSLPAVVPAVNSVADLHPVSQGLVVGGACLVAAGVGYVVYDRVIRKRR